MWMDGHGTVKANPAYGTGINSFLLDTLNDHGLELSDPYSNSVNDNWINFKTTLIESIQKHIPQKTCNSQIKGIYHG